MFIMKKLIILGCGPLIIFVRAFFLVAHELKVRGIQQNHTDTNIIKTSTINRLKKESYCEYEIKEISEGYRIGTH